MTDGQKSRGKLEQTGPGDVFSSWYAVLILIKSSICSSAVSIIPTHGQLNLFVSKPVRILFSACCHICNITYMLV